MRIIRAAAGEFVPASHEDSRQPGVLKRVLAVKDDLLNGRVQMINWARLPVGSAFRRHYHEDMQEVFVMLRGKVEITVDGERAALGPGDAIVIEPRQVHQMQNTSTEQVEYLVVGISLGQGGQTVVVEEPGG
jgi:mannose-6-phosphate isomerase-like protein (cupin superfamily)